MLVVLTTAIQLQKLNKVDFVRLCINKAE